MILVLLLYVLCFVIGQTRHAMYMHVTKMQSYKVSSFLIPLYSRALSCLAFSRRSLDLSAYTRGLLGWLTEFMETTQA